jgi:phosphatidylglycerol:prolipoprotein diacylglycerol transferase
MLPHIQAGVITLNSYGLLLTVALIVAFCVLAHNLIRQRVPINAHLLFSCSVLSGFVGAKLWHILESPDGFGVGLLIRMMDSTGFAYYGGVVFGSVAIVVLARSARISILQVLDNTAGPTCIGYAIARIGCLLAGDGDYGKPTSVPWAMSFPHGLVPTFQRVHPTPIYEAGLMVLIFLFIQRQQTFQDYGRVFSVFLILSGIERFLIEYLRRNPPIILGLSSAQCAAILSVVMGLYLMTVRVKLKTQEQAASEILAI